MQFGGKLVVASSMADTVMIHLAEQVARHRRDLPRHRYHFVETIGTRDAVKLVHNVNVINVTPNRRWPSRTRLGQGSVRPRSRSVLRTSQGRPARQGP
jgi:phosphoadenosine phosphosulfate reductase